MRSGIIDRMVQAQAHAEAQPYDVRLVLWRDGIEVDFLNPKTMQAVSRRVTWADVESGYVNTLMEAIDYCSTVMAQTKVN